MGGKHIMQIAHVGPDGVEENGQFVHIHDVGGHLIKFVNPGALSADSHALS
jgi:hypothetical protein